MSAESKPHSELFATVRAALSNLRYSNEQPNLTKSWMGRDAIHALNSLEEQFEAAERARKLLTNALAYYADLEDSGHSDWTMATETLEALYGWVPQPETRIPPLSNPAKRPT